MSGDTEFPLPDDLPEPEDDGAADHLFDADVPSVPLTATDGTTVDLSAVTGRTVVYCYPKTGRPDKDVIPEVWEEIPGARGCTPESCGFRDQYRKLLDEGLSEVYGISVQSSKYQREARDRLDLPFEILSDASLALTDQLDLPTFEVAGERLLERQTFVISDGRIEHVFYPIFPPDEHADEVLRWLEHNG